MDFVRLGPANSTTYLVDQLIEGYNSLIWTERFQEHGEFELKSFNVLTLMALLPEDTLVSHLDTKHVMMVETHDIAMVGEGEDARPEITITGRSATLILEHRWVESAYQKKRRMRQKMWASSAIATLLYNAVDNPSGYDVTRGDTDADTPEYNNYSWTKNEVIPNVAVTESVSNHGTSRWWQLEQGTLYPQLQKIAIDADHGLRCLRPVSPNPATVFTVDSALATRGTVTRTPVSNVTQLRFDVYEGTDRSASVQFSQLQGHLDNPHYLISKREHKTQVELMTGSAEVGDVYLPNESGLTGWQRRTMGFDGGSVEIPPEPDKPDELKSNATAAQKKARAAAMDKWIDAHAKWKNKRAAIIADFREEQSTAALAELKKNRRVNMFSGDVSALSPFAYGTHYFLGDTVMLFGDYGRSAKMIVSEYVRTEDVNGDRGFPGLVEP